jgi:hypothetical protein
MRDLGNDLSIGARLAGLAAAAGLEVTELAAGVATEVDVERWDSALQRPERRSGERLVYVPPFRVVARRAPVATVSRS